MSETGLPGPPGPQGPPGPPGAVIVSEKSQSSGVRISFESQCIPMSVYTCHFIAYFAFSDNCLQGYGNFIASISVTYSRNHCICH